MKKLEVKIWAVLAAVFAVLGGACLTWEPIRFGAAFLGALAVGCTGEAFMVAFCGKNTRSAAGWPCWGGCCSACFLASFVGIQTLIVVGRTGRPRGL